MSHVTLLPSDNLTTTRVFTTEILNGIPVDQCADLDETHRKFIACKILELILRELMEFRYMQTDPNWANFLYDAGARKVTESVSALRAGVLTFDVSS